jgi:RNA polymerase sigma-70 factor (ECF subfamily)
MDEQDLVRRAQAGDREALARLLEAAIPKAYPAALAIMRNQQDAEDALQEAAITALNQIHTLRSEAAFASWFLRIVVNRCRDLLRRRRVRAADPLEDAPAAPAPRGWAIESSMDLTVALADLSADHRAAVLLHHGMGYPTDQVAQMLGKAPGTVRRMLSEAYRTMRLKLGDRYTYEG